ncbi:MAG: signal peptide peptidase SppA [Nanobdellota archaeon]
MANRSDIHGNDREKTLREDSRPKDGAGRMRWGYVLGFLIVLFLLSNFIAGFFNTEEMGNVAEISINGMIATTGGDSFSSVTSSEEIIELIEKAENRGMEAIIFRINSGGGSPVASDEIGQKIKDLNMTTVSAIRDAGASGAYWVATATDHIIANRMSITGSIGVTSSYLELSGLLEDHNVTYRRLVSGEYKDMGSPFKELSEEEKDMMMDKLETIEGFFIDEVAENREMKREEVEELATGEWFLGSEAKEEGLVDELGTMEDAESYLENELDRVDIVEMEKEKSFFERLSSVYTNKGKILEKTNPQLQR